MGEYTDTIRQMATIAPTLAATNLDQNPDDAAQALKLSGATGIPAPVINQDVPAFQTQYKAKLADDLIRNNSQLDAYIRSHPLAAQVSNDDYGNLDQLSRAMSPTAQIMKAIKRNRQAGTFEGSPLQAGVEEGGPAAIQAFKDSFGSGPLDWGFDPNDTRLNNAIRTTLWTPFELATRAGLGVMGAVGAGAPGFVAGSSEQAAAIVGLPDPSGFGKAMGGLVESKMMSGDLPEAGRAAFEAREIGRDNSRYLARQIIKRAWKEYQYQLAERDDFIKPYIDAGVQPPAGGNALVDLIYGKANAELLQQLNDQLAAAQESFTKERSPEMFQKFIQQHFQNGTIGIDGRVVSELYPEGKVPMPDDGLLGWVPGIEDKLAAARATDTDVTIPIADWLTKVDPALAKKLNDDIRMDPGWITAREAKETPVERAPAVEAPIAQIRDYLGTEPMLSLGDRQVTLERMMDEAKTKADEYARQQAEASGQEWKAPPFHDFVLKTDSGQEIGTLNITEHGKQLYVDWIGGIGGWGPRDLGPAAIRDMLRQLKAFFPDAEEVTGHRVSGARGEAGTYYLPSANIKLKLAEGEAPAGWGQVEAGLIDPVKDFQNLLEDSHWRNVAKGLEANIKPTELFSQHEADLTNALKEEAGRLVGPGVDVQGVQGFRKPGQAGNIRGAYLHAPGLTPKILVDLFGPDSMGVLRHETIHHLRAYNLIKPEEWSTLAKAAQDEGWVQRYGIDRRYGHLSTEKQTEEAVAEAFRNWMSNKDTAEAKALGSTPVTSIFQKLSDLWDGVKAKWADILGHEPSWEELFQKIDQGEIKDRAGTAGHQIEPMFSIEEKDALQTQLDNLRASGTWLNAKSFGIIQKLIRERYESDLEAAMKRAEKEQAKRQTDEWKSNYKDVRKEVEGKIRQRPDVAADLFLGSGEMGGHKLEQRYRIATDSLTEEQRAALPRHYYGKEGLPLDGLAHLFGFPDGDSMVEGLVKYNAAKGGDTPQEMLGKVVKAETDRQMEARYGFLEKNILEDAKDQALSDTDINILAEELHAAGMLTGQTVLDKNAAATQAFDMFKKMPIDEVSSDRFMQGVARHAREIERNLLAGDNATAIIGMQKKLISMMLAQHARRLEKELKSFEKVAKSYSRREVPGIDIEYLNYIHQTLLKIGKPVRRSIQDLAKEIEARATPGSENFEKFVATVNDRGREMPVWPELLNDAWHKQFETLTTEEFRNVRDSIKTMIFNGRNEMKIVKEGEAADLAEVLESMTQSLSRFKTLRYDIEGERVDTHVPELVRTYIASHFKLETILNRWDQYDPFGDWNQYVMRPLFEGANQEDAWRKEYAKRLTEAGDTFDLNKTIANNLFRDPARGEIPGAYDPLERMTRANLRVVMLNMGTEMNFTKLAKGYGLERDEIEAWVHTFATQEDWDFVRKVWAIFKDVKEKSDTMYRSMTGGVPAQDVLGRMIQSPKFGAIEGGYYPLIAHPVFESKYHRTDPNSLFDNHYTRASTPAGYMEQRTGAIYPLSLSLDAMPGRLAQMIHDIALRPAVVQASKVFYNSKIRAAVRTHFGAEYSNMMEPYLRDIANSRNYMPKDQQTFAKWSEAFRQNMITTLVGFNPGTVLKHGPTAMIQSMQEVGYGNFLREMKGMFSIDPQFGERNWEFAKEKSLELQRRDRHWQETLGGAVDQLVPSSKLGGWRSRIMYWASKPVALSDMISAVPTWLAAYKDALGKGRSDGDAVYLADRAVRRAHGSTSIADRPSIMRGGTGWLTAVYNFFNHIMNRQAEMIWKAGEVMDLVRDREWGEASRELTPLAGQLFAYVLAPALIEEMVAPLVNAQTKRDQKEQSWGKTAGMGLAFTLSSSWVGVRDIANAILHGSDPTVGLLSTALKAPTDFYRDWNKKAPFGKDHAGRLIRDGMVLLGTGTGIPGQQVGRLGQFAHDLKVGKEKPPKGLWGWLVGLRYGTTTHHSKTFDDWLKGKAQ